MTRFWRHMSIGRRLVFAFGTLIVLFTVLGLTAVRTTGRLAREVVKSDAPLVESSLRVQVGTLELRRFEKDVFLNIGSPAKQAEYVDKWHGELSKLEASLTRLEQLVVSAEDRAAIGSMRQRAAAYREGLGRVVAEIRDGTVKTPQDANAAITPTKDAIRSLEEDAGKLASEFSQALAAKEVSAVEQVDTTVARLGIGLLLTAGLGLVMGGLVIRRLTRDIGSAVQHLQTSSSQLQVAVNQQASASKEQAAATTETTTTIRELVATARQIAGSAERVGLIANQTASAARNGEATVQRAQGALGGIQRQVELVVQHMVDLGRKSQQIGGILEIINELAEQTNILAINATIEAAGAGETGKRFAVVADEIRKLADRVGASSRDIRGLIEEIRMAVNTAVMATEQGTKSVEQGARQVADVATAFGEIVSMVGTTTEAAREIELSTKQQTTAVEQVSTAMTSVAQAAKETEATSSETLQTAVQLATLSKDLTRLIRAHA